MLSQARAQRRNAWRTTTCGTQRRRSPLARRRGERWPMSAPDPSFCRCHHHIASHHISGPRGAGVIDCVPRCPTTVRTGQLYCRADDEHGPSSEWTSGRLNRASTNQGTSPARRRQRRGACCHIGGGVPATPHALLTPTTPALTPRDRSVSALTCTSTHSYGCQEIRTESSNPGHEQR